MRIIILHNLFEVWGKSEDRRHTSTQSMIRWLLAWSCRSRSSCLVSSSADMAFFLAGSFDSVSPPRVNSTFCRLKKKDRWRSLQYQSMEWLQKSWCFDVRQVQQLQIKLHFLWKSIWFTWGTIFSLFGMGYIFQLFLHTSSFNCDTLKPSTCSRLLSVLEFCLWTTVKSSGLWIALPLVS